MIKEIKYNGLSAVPSDYAGPDGDLSLSIGLINEDGALKPILRPAEVDIHLDDGASVKYIHETAAFRNYIIQKPDEGGEGKINIGWVANNDNFFIKETEAANSPNKKFNTVHRISSIGNTLLILADDGMHYILWKGGTTGYLYLGTHIPECPLSFGLQGEMISSEEFNISFDTIYRDELFDEFTDSNKDRITEQVLAKVNKFVAEESTNKGKFIYPFLLRYAYRLYDGSLTMHSSPVLMIASSDLAPQAFVTNYTVLEGIGSIQSANIKLAAMLHTIDYAVVFQQQLDKLKDWKDIVTSVDVFVSQPIYTYDQNGQCTSFKNVTESDCYCVCKHTNQAASQLTYPLRYQKNDFHKLYAFTYDPVTFEFPILRLMLPRKSEEAVKSDIKDCHLFYFLDSIKFEHLSTERKTITVKEDYLQSLANREVMTDDYDSHDTLLPKYAFTYNSRINLSGMEKVLFEGHNTACLFNYSDGYVSKYSNEEPLSGDGKGSWYAYVFIKQDGKDIVVKCEGHEFGYKAPLLFFYYPNPNAYRALIIKRPTTNPYEVKLEKHNFLNGAFYFNGWDDLSITTTEILPKNPSDVAMRTIQLPNKIYTSEINNPFHFPLLGINTIGTGAIIGLSTAAKALSEGQFGQFPLYAFTTDGIWALEVSNTGTYSARQPITRDVLIKDNDGNYNVRSITQIDDAVLFATDRGIMLISGSQTRCISDTINNIAPFNTDSLPKMQGIISLYNSMADLQENLNSTITVKPFLDFIKNGRMLYDYTHRRIIVYNPYERYAYVYSLKTNTWGMIQSWLIDNVNAYPEALAMVKKRLSTTLMTNILVDFTKEPETDTPVTSLIVTRPFKLDAHDIHKTIDTIIQRGVFPKESIRQLLYGSNDLYNWHPVWSSQDKYLRGFRGTPYKAFRLAIIARLDKEESLYGCSVQYTPRLTNKPR